MARPREFNEASAVKQAVDVFWSKGYADTSIADLEEALGMGRQSIYNTFGDKRALFLKALQYYHDQGYMLMESAFSPGNRGFDAIRSYINGSIAFLTNSAERRGCFLTRSLVDHGTVDEEVAATCTSNTKHLEDFFGEALREAVEDGILSETFDVQSAARLLSTQVYGLSVMARSGASVASMRASVDFLLDRFLDKK